MINSEVEGGGSVEIAGEGEGASAGETKRARANAKRPALKARKMGLSFGPEIPKLWFWKSAFATNLVNSLNLLFPLGERFFIRAVKHYADQIKDPTLADQVRGFYAQEARHAFEHERFFEAMEAQGYSIRKFLEVYEKIAYGFIEPISPAKLRLSVTVACEHLTAMFAERALQDGFLEAGAHPALRDLLLWHAAEEIEHKSVAFDLLKEVDPRYSLRILGMVVASTLLFGFWIAGALMLFAQDRASPITLAKHMGLGIKERRISGKKLFRSFFDYLRPSFHPADHDNFHLASDYFASIGHGAAAAS